MGRAALILATSLALSALLAASTNARTPQIGRDGPELDACGGIASITTFEAEIPVREEPDEYARVKTRLPVRTLVWLCDVEGDFQGIVYPTGDYQKLGDCNVSRPIAAPKAYNGPCASGWVMARNLSLVAS